MNETMWTELFMQNEKNAVKAIHKSTVTGHDLSVVLETYLALYH